MNTLAIRAGRVKSPSVRGISRYRRFPEYQIIEMPGRKRSRVISRLKFWSVMVLASFLFVTAVNEGVRTWLKTSSKGVESSKDFIVPGSSSSIAAGPSQTVMYQVKPVDQIGILREQNRYRVDMTRENYRFMNELLGSAERVTSRLSR